MPQAFGWCKRLVGGGALSDNGAMKDDDKASPDLTEKGREQAEERRRRQAEALRANLARRKAQTRAREGTPVAPVAVPGYKGST